MQSIPSRPHVLYVEDDDDTRAMLAEVLTCAGCEVTTAATAGEGLDALDARRPFHIVLTDYSLPDGNGIGMLSEAKARGTLSEATRLVLLTAEPLRAMNGVTVLRKPLGADALVRALCGILADGA
jgi:CheY-like chemotaxis protein